MSEVSLFLPLLLCAIQLSSVRLHPVLDESESSRIFGATEMCQLSAEHLRSFGRWVSVSNDSHSMPLVVPSRVALRKVSPDQLHLSPDSEMPVVAGETHCPDEVKLGLKDKTSLMSRALCPWYWRINYDPYRIPAILPEAVCRCQTAVTARRDVVYECHQVKMDVRVLRFDVGCQIFTEDVEPISFACVTAHQPAHVWPKHNGVEAVRQMPETVE